MAGTEKVIDTAGDEPSSASGYTDGSIPPQKGVDEKQEALYEEFKNRDVSWHQQETKTLLKKVDLHLLPLLVLM